MILISTLLNDFPLLGTAEPAASGNLDFGGVVTPAAIALIIGFAVVAVGLAISHDVD